VHLGFDDVQLLLQLIAIIVITTTIMITIMSRHVLSWSDHHSTSASCYARGSWHGVACRHRTTGDMVHSKDGPVASRLAPYLEPGRIIKADMDRPFFCSHSYEHITHL
jgi:hypothetical protein